MASTSAAAAFYADFQRLKADVLAAIDTGGAVPALSELRTALAGVRGSLPAYDQRRYDLQIKELEGLLAARAPAKSKFAFKRAAKSASTTPTPTPPAPTPASPPVPIPAAPTPAAPTPAAPTYTLADRSDVHLSAADLSPAGGYTLTLSDLTRCTVDLRFGELTSLHASNLRDCTIIAPRMRGSALLSHLTGCVVVLGAQQFRLHESSACVVALSVGSLPVVEGCRGVVVGAYPLPLADEFAADEGKYAQVQDFDWVRPGPSPHWRVAETEVTDELRAALANGALGEIQTIPCIQRYTKLD